VAGARRSGERLGRKGGTNTRRDRERENLTRQFPKKSVHQKKSRAARSLYRSEIKIPCGKERVQKGEGETLTRAALGPADRVRKSYPGIAAEKEPLMNMLRRQLFSTRTANGGGKAPMTEAKAGLVQLAFHSYGKAWRGLEGSDVIPS